MNEATSAQEATTCPTGKAATVRREFEPSGHETDSSELSPSPPHVPPPRRRSDPIIGRAEELISRSRRQIDEGTALLEYCNRRLVHNRQRLLASQEAGGQTLRNVAAELAHLRRALESRATIDQAKGVIMAEYGCDPEHAFEVLVGLSQSANTKLRDVAAEIVAGAVR